MKRYSGVSIDVEEDRSQKRSRKGLKKSNTVSMQVPQEKRRTRRHSWTRNMTLPSLSLSESKTPSPSSSNSSSPVSSLSSSLTAIRKKKRYSNMLGNTYCGCDYEKIDKNSPNFEIYLELNYRKHFMSIPEKGSRRFCTLTTDPEKATLFQSMPCSQTNWTRHKNVSPVHLCGSVGLSRGGGFQKTALFYGRFHLHILSPCVLLSPDTLGFWYVWALIPKNSGHVIYNPSDDSYITWHEKEERLGSTSSLGKASVFFFSESGKGEVKGEVKREVKEEVKGEVKKEVREEVREEAEREGKVEVEGEAEVEVVVEVMVEVEGQVKEEAKGEARDETKKEEELRSETGLKVKSESK
eukprot:TRINITY_DN5167_c0_g1_i14.p1 TRINITY_DN5167_c0_g1~~TRINITY_DN5167_c0_g1_i14.p1  ORF type:complete len:353 (-),score=92.07 TRINITY_DN5167_c0_g1_i14:548-1606(-)